MTAQDDALSLDDAIYLAGLAQSDEQCQRILLIGLRSAGDATHVVRLAKAARSTAVRNSVLSHGQRRARSLQEIVLLAGTVEIPKVPVEPREDEELPADSPWRIRDDITLEGVKYIRSMSDVKILQDAAGTRKGRAAIIEDYLERRTRPRPPVSAGERVK